MARNRVSELYSRSMSDDRSRTCKLPLEAQSAHAGEIGGSTSQCRWGKLSQCFAAVSPGN